MLHGHHGIAAVRSHVLELAGRFDEAREQDTLATAATSNHPERRYLQGRAAAVGRRRATV